MAPEYATALVAVKSRLLCIVIHLLGPMTPERVTAFGTVLIIFSNIVKQVFSKVVWVLAIALTVALLSFSKRRLSDWKVVFEVVTKGPPALPVPLRYFRRPTLSNTNGVSSK